MNRAVVVLCLSACAAVGDPPVVESPLIVTEPNGQVQVDGPGYTMRFARNGFGAPQIPLPESLEIGASGRQVLATNSNCAEESRVGLAMYPGTSVTSDPADHFGGPPGMILTGNITQPPNMDGPAAVQLDVDYEVAYRVGAGTEKLAGRSTFTFYATGRIVRRDAFSAFERAMVDQSLMPFGCFGTPANFFVTSYWAFDPAGAVTVDALGNAIQDNAHAACTVYPGTGGIGVAWPSMDPMGGPTQIRYGVNGTANHVFDFVQNSPIVNNDFFDVTSAIQVGDAPSPMSCGGLLADLADLPLFADGNTDLTTNENGVYSIDDNREGTTLILTSGNENLPRGVALIVNAGASGHAIVTRNTPSSEPVAFIQRLDDTHLLFVFQDRLERNQEITIELF